MAVILSFGEKTCSTFLFWTPLVWYFRGLFPKILKKILNAKNNHPKLKHCHIYYYDIAESQMAISLSFGEQNCSTFSF